MRVVINAKTGRAETVPVPPAEAAAISAEANAWRANQAREEARAERERLRKEAINALLDSLLEQRRGDPSAAQAIKDYLSAKR